MRLDTQFVTTITTTFENKEQRIGRRVTPKFSLMFSSVECDKVEQTTRFLQSLKAVKRAVVLPLWPLFAQGDIVSTTMTTLEQNARFIQEGDYIYITDQLDTPVFAQFTKVVSIVAGGGTATIEVEDVVVPPNPTVQFVFAPKGTFVDSAITQTRKGLFDISRQIQFEAL